MNFVQKEKKYVLFGRANIRAGYTLEVLSGICGGESA